MFGEDGGLEDYEDDWDDGMSLSSLSSNDDLPIGCAHQEFEMIKVHRATERTTDQQKLFSDDIKLFSNILPKRKGDNQPAGFRAHTWTVKRCNRERSRMEEFREELLEKITSKGDNSSPFSFMFPWLGEKRPASDGNKSPLADTTEPPTDDWFVGSLGSLGIESPVMEPVQPTEQDDDCVTITLASELPQSLKSDCTQPLTDLAGKIRYKYRDSWHNLPTHEIERALYDVETRLNNLDRGNRNTVSAYTVEERVLDLEAIRGGVVPQSLAMSPSGVTAQRILKIALGSHASRIQAVWRSYRSRKIFLHELVEDYTSIWTEVAKERLSLKARTRAYVILRNRHLVHLKSLKPKNVLDQAALAIKIEGLWTESQHRHRGAVLVQSRWRGHAVRRSLRATSIQVAWRASCARAQMRALIVGNYVENLVADVVRSATKCKHREQLKAILHIKRQRIQSLEENLERTHVFDVIRRVALAADIDKCKTNEEYRRVAATLIQSAARRWMTLRRSSNNNRIDGGLFGLFDLFKVNENAAASSDMPSRMIHRREPRIEVGTAVVVNTDFKSNSNPPVVLKRGYVGVVKHIDIDGDAEIDFRAHKELQWVFRKNYDKLDIDKFSST